MSDSACSVLICLRCARRPVGRAHPLFKQFFKLFPRTADLLQTLSSPFSPLLLASLFFLMTLVEQPYKRRTHAAARSTLTTTISTVLTDTFRKFRQGQVERRFRLLRFSDAPVLMLPDPMPYFRHPEPSPRLLPLLPPMR